MRPQRCARRSNTGPPKFYFSDLCAWTPTDDRASTIKTHRAGDRIHGDATQLESAIGALVLGQRHDCKALMLISFDDMARRPR